MSQAGSVKIVARFFTESGKLRISALNEEESATCFALILFKANIL